LNLFNNSLEGPLPSLVNWTQLFYLDLGYNKFTGTIPDEWVYGQSSLLNIRHLYLDHNKLDGTLPSMFPSMGRGRVEHIDISNNNFTGSYAFDTTYETKQFLAVLEIQNNSLSYIMDDVCKLSIFEGGELVRINADCNACSCKTLCDKCISSGSDSTSYAGATGGKDEGKEGKEGKESHEGPGGRDGP
jgi:hypothetical protein